MHSSIKEMNHFDRPRSGGMLRKVLIGGTAIAAVAGIALLAMRADAATLETGNMNVSASVIVPAVVTINPATIDFGEIAAPYGQSFEIGYKGGDAPGVFGATNGASFTGVQTPGEITITGATDSLATYSVEVNASLPANLTGSLGGTMVYNGQCTSVEYGDETGNNEDAICKATPAADGDQITFEVGGLLEGEAYTEAETFTGSITVEIKSTDN